MADRHCDAVLRVAEVHAYSGRTDEAFQWLHAVLAHEQPGARTAETGTCLTTLVEQLRGSAFARSLRGDPRLEEYFNAVLERL